MQCGDRATVGTKSPLDDAVILKQVLSYAGAGEWGFFAPISKLWLECYRAVPVHRVTRKLMHRGECAVEALPHITLRRAVFACSSRVRLAHELGVRFGTDSADLQFYTGYLACKAALADAHRLGMPCSQMVLNGAAFSGNISAVIWLHTEHFSCSEQRY
jgi:hypothetical protein